MSRVFFDQSLMGADAVMQAQTDMLNSAQAEAGSAATEARPGLRQGFAPTLASSRASLGNPRAAADSATMNYNYTREEESMAVAEGGNMQPLNVVAQFVSSNAHLDNYATAPMAANYQYDNDMETKVVQKLRDVQLANQRREADLAAKEQQMAFHAQTLAQKERLLDYHAAKLSSQEQAAAAMDSDMDSDSNAGSEAGAEAETPVSVSQEFNNQDSAQDCNCSGACAPTCARAVAANSLSAANRQILADTPALTNSPAGMAPQFRHGPMLSLRNGGAEQTVAYSMDDDTADAAPDANDAPASEPAAPDAAPEPAPVADEGGDSAAEEDAPKKEGIYARNKRFWANFWGRFKRKKTGSKEAGDEAGLPADTSVTMQFHLPGVRNAVTNAPVMINTNLAAQDDPNWHAVHKNLLAMEPVQLSIMHATLTDNETNHSSLVPLHLDMHCGNSNMMMWRSNRMESDHGDYELYAVVQDGVARHGVVEL